MKKILVLALLAFVCVTAQAGLVMAESENGTLDSKLPEIAISSPMGGSFIHGDSLLVEFCIEEDCFAESPVEPVQLSFYIDTQYVGIYDVNLMAEEGGIYSLYWQIPEILADSVFVRVSATDYFGNYSQEYSEVFDIYGIADFVTATFLGDAPLEVQFYDQSAGYITNWAWDFQNDGVIDSYEQNPVWTYTEPGVYDVSLTVSDDAVRATITRLKENYITVMPGWQVDVGSYSYNGSIFGKVYIEYEEVTGTSGILGCFSGDECRGIASMAAGNVIDFTEDYGFVAFLPVVYSNIGSGEALHFKYWDPEYYNGEVLDVWGSLNFTANMSIGSLTEPHEFYVMPAGDMQKSLNGGWNWISLNIANESMAINDLFSSLGDNGIFIKNQTQSATYYPGSGWFGSIIDLNLNSMYMINMSTGDTLAYEGIAANIHQIEYELNSGWNWISYSPQETESLVYALADLGNRANLIKNQSSFSYFYAGAGWFGSLTELLPGEGYKLSMNEACNFTYPLPEPLNSNRTIAENNAKIVPAQRDFNPFAYQYNASLVLSSDEDISAASKVMAKYGSEIRGISEFLDYSQEFGRKFYALMVYSNEPCQEGYELYYLADAESEPIKLNYEFTFENDLLLGDFAEPLILNLSPAANDGAPQFTYALSAYPNPFNPETTINFQLAEAGQVQIDVYNIKGQKVESLLDDVKEAGKYSLVWNAENCNSGIYIISFSTAAGRIVKKAMLLK
jgi:PKD repeat protein